jgi:hypothetical protein
MTREMKAATVRVCAVAEWDEAVIRRLVHIAVRTPRLGGGGRALSGNSVDMVARK